MSTKSDGKTGQHPTPERCLSFTVRGPWGHFRRIDGNVVKQTYRIVPRTTVAGLIAGMLGIGRDEYYDYFARGDSAIAIEPTAELRTMNVPVNTFSTAAGDIKTVPKGARKLKVGLPDPTKLRQQHNYEVLVDPAYRIDCWLADSEIYDRLHETLREGKSHYVPSLGLSEYLAEVEFHGEQTVERDEFDDPVSIDSAVPDAVDDIVPEAGVNYGVERSPAFMTATDGGRTTTGFTAYGYHFEGGSLQVNGVNPAVVDGRNVLFV